MNTSIASIIAISTPILVLNAGLLAGDQPTEGSENTNPQDSTESKGYEPDSSQGFSFKAFVEGEFLSETDFDDNIGEFEYSAISAGISASRRIGDDGFFNVEFSAGLINYDISTSAGSVAGDAASIGSEFDDVYTLSLTAFYSDRLNDTTTWFVGGGVLSAGEEDADFGDTIDGLFTGGFRYQANDKLELGIGILVKTQLDDDVLIVPIPQIKYTIDDRWSIESKRAGLELRYKSSDALTYGVAGEYSSNTFRLDDSHTFATEGVATHRQIPVSFFAEYSPTSNIEIVGRIGAALGSELEILDNDGHEVTSQDIDAGVFGSLNLSFKF
jgi:Domain of unknown function (DUF6268)